MSKTCKHIPGAFSPTIAIRILIMKALCPLQHQVDRKSGLEVAYDGVRRVSELRREPAVSVVDPTHIHTELPTRGSGSSTVGSECCFSVGCVDRCEVLHGVFKNLVNCTTLVEKKYFLNLLGIRIL